MKDADSNGMLMPIAAHVKLSVRSNLAVHHLMAAALFARSARATEQKHLGEAFGSFFEEIMWNVAACVMMSVAAIEAHFNERMLDLDVDNTLLGLIERRSLIERHNYYLWFTDRPKFDVGKAPTQPFADLIELRDALVHFRPEWDDRQIRHAHLEKRLVGKFPISPFFASTDAFFPKRCISHGCAAWAVRCAREFGDAFADRIGVEPKFKALGKRLCTEP